MYISFFFNKARPILYQYSVAKMINTVKNNNKFIIGYGPLFYIYYQVRITYITYITYIFFTYNTLPLVVLIIYYFLKIIHVCTHIYILINI